MTDPNINLQVSLDEAIILQAFLARLNALDSHEFFEDQAEQRVLWDLECLLEKVVSVPYEPGVDILKRARDRVRDPEQ